MRLIPYCLCSRSLPLVLTVSTEFYCITSMIYVDHFCLRQTLLCLHVCNACGYLHHCSPCITICTILYPENRVRHLNTARTSFPSVWLMLKLFTHYLKLRHTVSHFSYAPLFQGHHFLTKMMESNIFLKQ